MGLGAWLAKLGLLSGASPAQEQGSALCSSVPLQLRHCGLPGGWLCLGLCFLCPYLSQQLCLVLSAGGYLLLQVLDGLLGPAELLQALLLPGLGGSQLFLQLSQAALQALASILPHPQLQRRHSISGCCVLCFPSPC